MVSDGADDIRRHRYADWIKWKNILGVGGGENFIEEVKKLFRNYTWVEIFMDKTYENYFTVNKCLKIFKPQSSCASIRYTRAVGKNEVIWLMLLLEPSIKLVNLWNGAHGVKLWGFKRFSTPAKCLRIDSHNVLRVNGTPFVTELLQRLPGQD